jgi:SHS2 domain-containing protein
MAPSGQSGGDAVEGRRLLPHVAGCIIEAWGPDGASCTTQALQALVECFAVVPDVPVTRLVPLEVSPAGPEDMLVSLLEEVIDGVDVFTVVPVRFHLAETEEGGIAGDMEVAPAEQVEFVGPVPKGVSTHSLSMARFEGGWRCRVLIEV